MSAVSIDDRRVYIYSDGKISFSSQDKWTDEEKEYWSRRISENLKVK